MKISKIILHNAAVAAYVVVLVLRCNSQRRFFLAFGLPYWQAFLAVLLRMIGASHKTP